MCHNCIRKLLRLVHKTDDYIASSKWYVLLAHKPVNHNSPPSGRLSAIPPPSCKFKTRPILIQTITIYWRYYSTTIC
ncbi:hypothetical protein RIR_jg39746.t1 [Rhizophagus irregularis DAOM 181602=DAOM 197198]|nr:hypothetical protein RIR_jg39746.t1 [Rhizophagus irregularis DAOM 181602=DAOM 197198]